MKIILENKITNYRSEFKNKEMLGLFARYYFKNCCFGENYIIDNIKKGKFSNITISDICDVLSYKYKRIRGE